MFFPSEAITRDGSFFRIIRMIQPISLKTVSIGCIAYTFLFSRAQKSIRISILVGREKQLSAVLRSERGNTVEELVLTFKD